MRKSKKHHGNTKPKQNRQNRLPQNLPKLECNLWGWHAVTESWLNPQRTIHAAYVAEKSVERFQPLFEQAKAKGLKRPEPQIVPAAALDQSIKGDPVHQGVALNAAPLPERDIQDIVISLDQAGKSEALFVMLDQVTDPHNVGAILRSAAAFGADALIVQKKHSPAMEGILAKTACGGLEHVPIIEVTNLSRAIEECQKSGFFATGLDESGEQNFDATKAHARKLLVLGAEGPGLRPLVAKHCDHLVALPTKPPIASLNVSNAAAIALYALKEK